MKSLIFQVVAAAMIPLVILFSLYLFFRGHNLPGGGFIAGLVTSLGIILVFLAYGLDFFEHFTFMRFNRIFALGLTFALGTGLGAVVCGYPFLTSNWWEMHLPILGHVEIASAMFFDLGVYLVVVGVVLNIIHELAAERGINTKEGEQ